MLTLSGPSQPLYKGGHIVPTGQTGMSRLRKRWNGRLLSFPTALAPLPRNAKPSLYFSFLWLTSKTSQARHSRSFQRHTFTLHNGELKYWQLLGSGLLEGILVLVVVRLKRRMWETNPRPESGRPALLSRFKLRLSRSLLCRRVVWLEYISG